MDNKELIKLAYDMGAHPYSVGGMVAALQKGIEIGKKEQKAIDEAEQTEEMRKLNEEWMENLEECKRQRDAYYDELQSYRQAEAEQRAEIQRFKKFLEDNT